MAKQEVDLALDIQTERAVFLPQKRIGLMGGTFNPVHVGHLLMAEQVYDKLGLDRVDFMPSHFPPHVDPKKTLPGEDRFEMLKLALGDNPHFGLETIELERLGKSYSVETLEILTTLHPENEYYFIIGGDMVDYLPKWYRIEDLVKMVHFVGVKRPGYVGQTSSFPIIYVDSPSCDVSSTAIRQAVASGHSIRYLVPEAVRHYIKEKGLYYEQG